MSRKTKTIKLGGETYEVREATLGDMVPLLPKFGDEATMVEAQLELCEKCTYQDGEQMGEKVREIGFTHFPALITAVLEVNELGDSSAVTLGKS